MSESPPTSKFTSGDTKEILYRLRYPNRAPLDALDWSARSHVAVKAGDAMLEEWAVVISVDPLDDAVLEVLTTLTPVQTAALPTRSVTDLEMTDPDGKVQTVATRILSKRLDVTQ